MTSIYINYPNREFSIKVGVPSEERFRHDKEDRRLVRITVATLSRELELFVNRQVEFASEARLNDLYLDIDFGDEEFERSVGEYVKRVLGKRYRPIAEAVIR